MAAAGAGGDGQGRRGHDVLLLRPAGVLQRSRRAGLADRHLGRQVSRVLPLPERALAEQPARHLDPRQQAQRGCAHADLAAVGDPGSLGGGAASVVAAERARLEQPHAGPARGVSAVPDADRRLADHAGALLAVHAEGVPRGEDHAPPGTSRTSATRRTSAASSRACSRRRSSSRASRRSSSR